MVPYHALAKLHQEVKAEMPKPYSASGKLTRKLSPR